MSTPALDDLADMLHDEWADTPSGWHVRGLDAAGVIDVYDIVRPLAVAISRNPDLVLAALIESGWRPTDDDLRAMGGKQFGYAHRSDEGALEHSFLTRRKATPHPVWWFPKEATDG